MALEAGITLVNLRKVSLVSVHRAASFRGIFRYLHAGDAAHLFAGPLRASVNFLATYYPTTRMLASAIFRKVTSGRFTRNECWNMAPACWSRSL